MWRFKTSMHLVASFGVLWKVLLDEILMGKMQVVMEHATLAMHAHGTLVVVVLDATSWVVDHVSSS